MVVGTISTMNLCCNVLFIVLLSHILPSRSKSHPLIKKKQGSRNRKKMSLNAIILSPKQKLQICE